MAVQVNIVGQVRLGGLDRAVEILDENKIIEDIALVGEQIFVDEAPVDTGLLRANFFVTPRETDGQTFNRKSHTPSKPPPRQPELFIKNNINYAVPADMTSFRPMYIEKSIGRIRRYVQRMKFFDRRKGR